MASYLDAKRHGGHWLVRMEDIDPPREQPGAADHILRTLTRFGMESDAPVLYQSQRTEAYHEALDALRAKGLVFACTCSRRDLANAGGRYPGTCRGRVKPPEGAFAWRLQVDEWGAAGFADRVQGRIPLDPAEGPGDFVIWRRDGLPAYHLAAVVDDAYQKVSDVVRGADLITSTAQHIYLHRRFGSAPPRYAHLPVILGPGGHKLSKQTLAQDVFPSTQRAAKVLMLTVLQLLGIRPERSLIRADPSEQLAWACTHFSLKRLPAAAAFQHYQGLSVRGTTD